MNDDSNRVDFYDYDLPPHLIAAHPAPVRGESRLMVADPVEGAIQLTTFNRLGAHITSGDLLVFNDVRVIQSRVQAKKATGGAVELFVVNIVESNTDHAIVRCMTRSSKSVKPGELFVGESVVSVLEAEGGFATVRVPSDIETFLNQHGAMPLPPYILKQRKIAGEESVTDEDSDRYQTVYAKSGTAVAAPTAGLHFTRPLLDELSAAGVKTAQVTLDVGPGTFKPVTAERLDDHPMHSESYVIGNA